MKISVLKCNVKEIVFFTSFEITDVYKLFKLNTVFRDDTIK